MTRRRESTSPPRTSLLFFCTLLLWPASLPAQSSPKLGERIQKIVDRPEFRHANFGIEFYSLDEHRPVFTLNADKLFHPGSTTKLVTEGTGLELLGPDYRFHTRVYRTGDVATDGTLRGDLVLVASGDPNLSNRIQPDGTLAFEDHDHSYASFFSDARAVPGDPLLVIRELARQVASHGIKRIEGHVVVDVSLFSEGESELGSGVVISPIAVNDNVVDVTVEPGPAEGSPVKLRMSPETAYVHFVNEAKTGAPDSTPAIRWSSDVPNPDGSHTVTATGSMPAGKPARLYAYVVPQPSRFAEMAFVEALRETGVAASITPSSDKPNFKSLAVFYRPENVVGDHISPPLTEEAKVTLKVSQNLHASMMPFILGAVSGHQTQDADKGGFDLEHNLLEKAGLDLSGAAQSDGAGGAAYFTPDFMVQFLVHMAKQGFFPQYLRALPILGKDGTLSDIQVNSPAAGHVHAKTGTDVRDNALNRNMLVLGKGLAGYIETKDGRKLAFAIFANFVPAKADFSSVEGIGQALGEIAAAAYE